MSSASGDLLLAKVAASGLLTGASLLGLLAPFLFFRLLWPLLPSSWSDRAEHDIMDEGTSPANPTNARFVISIANCVSAGILLWTGMMHFFLESASSFSSSHICPLPAGTPCIEYGIGRATLCFMLGIFIPLTIEKVIWPLMSTVVGANTPHLDSQSGRSSEEGVASMLIAHGHSHGSAHHEHGTVVGRRDKESPGSLRGSVVRSRSRKAKDVASAVLIALLMSVHSATEGIAVGVEPTVASMRGSVAPLVVHKVFDGWLVGVGAYRLCDHAVRSSNILSIGRYLLGTSPQRYSLLVWLAALPATLLAVATVTPPAHAHHTGAEHEGHSHASATYSVAVAQATSSGSFLYVALCAIVMEELSGDHQPGSTKRNAMLIAACVVGLVLGSLLSGHH